MLLKFLEAQRERGSGVGEINEGERERIFCLAVSHHSSQVIINYLHALTQFAIFLGRWVLRLVVLAFLKTNEELPGM